MPLKFNPPKQVARYAVYIEDAAPKKRFRVYSNLGSAKNAYHHSYTRKDAMILENVNGEWYVLYTIPAGTMYKDLPWVKEVATRWYSYGPGTAVRAVPMTREEYAEWRIKVERERIENKFDISLVDL